MKKTLLFAIMAAVLGFTACSKEEPAQPETIRKGMVLHATVSQSDDTRASFTDNEGVWHFDYAEGDQITVKNNKISTYYTFTYNGTDFISTDAEPTSEPARWYAYYPSNEVSFVGQTGKWEDLANVYALVGGTPFFGGDVTGEDGLDITMDPKCAVLKIINQKGSIDINVKHKDNGYWIKGLKDSQASFVLTLGETKQTFLSTTEAGTFYVAVPAGTPLTVYDGEEAIRSTSKGLTAGNYYELTIELPFGQGYAEVDASAGIPGNKVKWIQLWEGGPKFAEFNIGATSATEYGLGSGWDRTSDDIANIHWGSKWRMPTKDELEGLDKYLFDYCTNKYITQKDVKGLLCTGKNVYSSNSVFFPTVEEISEANGYYWSSTISEDNTKRYALTIVPDAELMGVSLLEYRISAAVRAVLAEE